jgi:diguanylate cyclase (GGDEF)-like protein/PAS domain S-box-containing protein
MKTNDDSYKEISWRAYYTNDYILAAGVDVTQMKKKERALKRQIEIHSMFMNTTLTGLFQAMFDEPLDPDALSVSHESIDMYLAKERIVSLNQAFADQYHSTKEALLGRTLLEFFEEDLQTARKLFIQSLSSGKIYGEVRMKLLDGSFSYFFVDITTLKDSKGRIVGIVGLQVDINERKKSEEALKKSESKFRLLAEYASDMIWVFNLQTHKFTYFSPSVHRVLGWSVEEIKESDYTKTMFKTDAKVAYQRINAWIREFKKTRKVNRNWSLQLRHYKKDGHLVWIESSINFKENDDGVIEVIGVSRDISDKKRAEADLLYSNYHDQLTHVYNRRYIEEQLSTIIENSEFPIAIITCDINGLKLTNDVFGHATGDDLLSHTGALLQSFANEHDIVAREGGDEFLMILPHTTKEQAEQRVLRIKEKGSTILVGKVSISLSIGVAVMEHKDDSYDEIYALSEHYLYRNKLVESSTYKEQIIMLLLSNLFEKYPHLQLHSEHVASLSKLLAIELGLDEHDVNEIYIAGKLHDIGKIGFEDSIIHPTQPITETQQFLLQRHSELGFHILKSAQHYGKIADWVLSHHERPDGKGYPRGLKKHQIPLQSHILHVATAMDNVMSKQHYSNTYINTAIQFLVERKSTMYDDRVLNALESLSVTSIEELEGVLSWTHQKN